MPKFDFNNVANHTSAWVFSCKFAAYFQNTFFLEHHWMAASESSKLFPKKLPNQQPYIQKYNN